MERRTFISGIGVAAGLSATPFVLTTCQDSNMLQSEEIQHMVIFDLKYEKGAPEIARFLNDGKALLGVIPGVKAFQAFDQVSPKNDYGYGFSMIFANQEDYQQYNNHPAHKAFVEERFKPEVTRFLEIDFKVFNG